MRTGFSTYHDPWYSATFFRGSYVFWALCNSLAISLGVFHDKIPSIWPCSERILDENTQIWSIFETKDPPLRGAKPVNRAHGPEMLLCEEIPPCIQIQLIFDRGNVRLPDAWQDPGLFGECYRLYAPTPCGTWSYSPNCKRSFRKVCSRTGQNRPLWALESPFLVDFALFSFLFLFPEHTFRKGLYRHRRGVLPHLQPFQGAYHLWLGIYVFQRVAPKPGMIGGLLFMYLVL